MPDADSGTELRHRLDGCREPPLAARGHVLLHDSLAEGSVEHAVRAGERRCGSRFVAGVDRLANALDRRAHARAHAGIVLPADFTLARALLGGLDIGHGLPEPL